MATSRSVLIVDSNDATRQILMTHLAAHNELRPIAATTLAEAARYLGATEARFDSVIVEVSLSDGDGCDFCAQLRQQGYKMPIIMLTSESVEGDVIRGMNAGANDYLTRPLRVNELLARLRAHLRVFDSCEDAVFTIGAYTFRPAAKLLAKHGENRRIRLTSMEVGILKFLYRTHDRVVPRQTLLDEVWGYAGATTRTLETHIYRLRRKMEVNPAECRLLLTMPGGYQLDLTG